MKVEGNMKRHQVYRNLLSSSLIVIVIFAYGYVNPCDARGIRIEGFFS